MKQTYTSRSRPAALLLLLLALLTLLPGLPAAAEEEHDIRRITISAVGDCTLGRSQKMDYFQSWNYLFDRKGSGYFLQNVEEIFQEDDLTIANLEGILSDSAKRRRYFYRQRQDRYQEKQYCHLGRPAYITALTEGGVDAVSFANNHNIDYGLQGFTDTVETCALYGLPAAYYDTLVRCEVRGLTVGILSVDLTYCSLDIAESYLRAGMADLNRDCDLIVACMHWGNNNEKQASGEQAAFGHLCVELGADLVLGCHAHVLQGVERYKGRYIFYSLGNFCYGGNILLRDADTVIAQQTFTFVDGELQLDDAVRLIPCRVSTHEEYNDYCPVPLTGKEARRVLRKINTRSEAFGLRFDGKGRPKVEPAADTELPPPVIAEEALRAEEIPSIIRVLLGVEDAEIEQLREGSEPVFLYRMEETAG